LLKSQHAIRPFVGAAIGCGNDNGDVRLQRTAVVQGVNFPNTLLPLTTAQILPSSIGRKVFIARKKVGRGE
jgi:hypothetical protein